MISITGSPQIIQFLLQKRQKFLETHVNDSIVIPKMGNAAENAISRNKEFKKERGTFCCMGAT